MSGGIAQLVAIGAQDVHLVGEPEISFFRSTYRRHTNFAQTVERQVIQGNPATGRTSTIRFERKGDLLSYVYLTCTDGTQMTPVMWDEKVDKVELLIGGQVIDTQESEFMSNVAIDTQATTLSRSSIGGMYAGFNNASSWFPLRFWFCENYQSALPLVALQYHDVELRITWGTVSASDRFECFGNFVYLDNQERQDMAQKEHNMLITQVQRAEPSGGKVQDLQFNHPVKYMASSNTAVSATTGTGLASVTNRIKFQINGTDVTDFKYASPHYTQVTCFYHVPNMTNNNTKTFVYPFCLDTAKHQPTGTLNFSRLDSARIISETDNITSKIYAVNYNVLKINNGMAGLMYAN
jgi:hypothetical protein